MASIVMLVHLKSPGCTYLLAFTIRRVLPEDTLFHDRRKMHDIRIDIEHRPAPLPKTEKSPAWLPMEGMQTLGKYNKQGQAHIINIRRATEAEGGSRYVYVARLSTDLNANPQQVGGALEATQRPILDTLVEDLFKTLHYEEPALIEWVYLPCNGPDHFCLR